MKYCPTCGSTVILQTPEDDTRERHVCSGCKTIHYENPRNVVGTIPIWQDKVLLIEKVEQFRQEFQLFDFRKEKVLLIEKVG